MCRDVCVHLILATVALAWILASMAFMVLSGFTAAVLQSTIRGDEDA